MRFHIVSVPCTQATAAYSACGFTTKVRRFTKMMKGLGHTVFLYAGEETDVECDELITCISEADRAEGVGSLHYSLVPFDGSPHWQKFNARVAEGIKARAEPTDFICILGGTTNKPIADALPHLMCVEFGIGYSGTFSRYRVFESYAWMHTVYGADARNADTDGKWFDAVIPGFFDVADFPYRGKHRRDNDYYLYFGRFTDRKGINIAVEVCRANGKRLVVAGQGIPPAGVEHVIAEGSKERGLLLAGATAVFMPTIYLEPFGNVAVEAQLCGTPVICTDWGAMTETVEQGVSGFRCRTFAEFSSALEDVKTLDPQVIHRRAVKTYSLEAIAPKYQAYFERLTTLWDKGWYQAA